MIDIIKDIHRALINESLFGGDKNSALSGKIMFVLSGMTASYEVYSEHMPALLNLIDDVSEKVFPHLTTIFFNLYNNVIDNAQIKEFKMIDLDPQFDNGLMLRYAESMLLKFPKGSQIRLSEANFNVDNVSKSDLEQIIAITHGIIREAASTIHWNEEKVGDIMFPLVLARQAAISTNNEELFYLLFGMFIDRLNTSDFHQKARDTAEEVLASSFKDFVPEYGFYISFRAYSGQHNTNTGLLYGIFTFISILRKLNEAINNKLYVEVVWETVRFFRNIRFYDLLDNIISIGFDKEFFKPFEIRQIMHGYLSSLMSRNDDNLVSVYEEYLSEWREQIIDGGADECIPWLTMLYNISIHYITRGYYESSLPYYMVLFESIVPAQTVEQYKQIILRNNPVIKDYFKETLRRLSETRNKTDFTNDVTKALMIAGKLTLYAYENDDYESFLLAMLVNSDFSYVFQDKNYSNKYIRADFVSEQDDSKAFIENLIENVSYVYSINESPILWLSAVDGNTYCLLYDKKFSIDIITDFSPAKVSNWKFRYFDDLVFSTSVKDRGQVRMVFPEEHEAQSLLIKKQLSFSVLPIRIENPLLIVKDMDLAQFPHNLLMDSTNEYVLAKRPITNILSIEWFTKQGDAFSLPNEFSKEIWIPIEDNDWPLLQIYSKLEDSMKKEKIIIHEESQLKNPLNSEMNIVIAHGDKSIHSFYALYTSDNIAMHNIDSIIGKGKILILFVCHAGSSSKGAFDNKIASFVRVFLENGYGAVIAPYWALNIDIPPIWLPVFLNSMSIGKNVSQAFFDASQAVKHIFPTPAAWACLHLYGNPYLKIN